jgi:putative membrane-bound dehydrogenase-like protein
MVRGLGLAVVLGPVLSFSAAAQESAPPKIADPSELVPAGAAKVDVTPAFPVRLCGYAARDAEPTGTAQHLFARALALGEGDSLAVLLAVDNCAVPASITDEVAARLAKKSGLARDRFTLCSTHTHSGPWLDGSLVLMFGRPVPEEQLAHVKSYTSWFIDRLEEAGLAAIAARAPATLSWGQGRAFFARNRRTVGGPTDPSLPILAVRAADGTLRAVVQNYACHCTTNGPGINQYCGDWAGYASETVEAAHAGAVALTVIGCGADANPSPGGSNRLSDAIDHGRAIATEIERLLTDEGELHPLHGPPACKRRCFDLSFGKLPTRAELEERAKKNDPVGFHAKYFLAKLDAGESLPTELPYVVQTWTFGDELAQVFLAGEVVVDYSLRLKREFDRRRLWISGYSNDVCCYIPSRRILAEGGYEAEGAMTYYGRPTRLSVETEDRIVDAAHQLLPESFHSHEQEDRFPLAKSAAEEQKSFQLSHPELDVELVACEPQVQSPVAIDFGADGTLWVCEMNDYPSGMAGHYEPGGRVVWLKDKDGDGRYESSGVFLEGLPFPTGVMAWKKGVLICAAPDILYAEDTDGDGKADVKKVLFTGFSTENYQARVNSLSWGLDGWVYGAAGIFGGIIQRGDGSGEPVDLRQRDFRMNPDTLAIEAVDGATQHGRARDDFGRWYGCDSGDLIWQYPLADRYVRRNPFIASPSPRHEILKDKDPRQLFQISKVLERFNDLGDASRVTSACGLGIYRDVALGRPFYGNAFTCEPVGNLVRRTVLEQDGAVMKGHRAPEEQEKEFLASTDPWFRPVQATTGPDGALWIVDMYRFVIEHPRWISPSRLAELDVRAGADLGRIWRVVPRGKKLRPCEDLTRLPSPALADRVSEINGVVRDLAHRELLARPRPSDSTERDACRDALVRKWERTELQGIQNQVAQALRAGDEWLGDGDVRWLLQGTTFPRLQIEGLRMAEARIGDAPTLGEAMAATAATAASGDLAVVFQAVLSLGKWDDSRAGEVLGAILERHIAEPWIVAAVLTSAPKHCAALLAAALAIPADTPGRADAIEKIVATAGALPIEMHHQKLHVLRSLEGDGDAALHETWRWRAMARVYGGMERLGELNGNQWWIHDVSCPVSREPVDSPGSALGIARRLEGFSDAAWAALRADPVDPETAIAALELLFIEPWHAEGREPVTLEREPNENLKFVDRLLEPQFPVDLQLAALAALGRSHDPGAVPAILAALPGATPQLRTSALDFFFARRGALDLLLDAVEKGSIPKSCFDASHRDRLLKHEDAALRERATKLFAPNGTLKRAQVLEQFKPALDLKGDPPAGRAVFEKVCASCHRMRGLGHEVGPDLAAVGDKSPAAYLNSILDPNAAVNADYVAYNVDLVNGDALTGLIRGESSSGFTLLMANDVRSALLRRDVKSVAPSKVSLMPENLEEGYAPQDFANLIAWLRGAPAPLGSSSDEQCAKARAELRAARLNGVGRVLESMDVFTQPSWLGPATMHYCRQTDGCASVKWRTLPVAAAAAGPGAGDSAAGERVAFSFPAAVGFLSQPKGKFTLKLDGKGLLEFDVVVDDAHFEGPAGAALDYVCRQANSEDSTGIMTLTVPARLVAAGRAAELEVIGSAANSQRWFGVLLCPDE